MLSRQDFLHTVVVGSITQSTLQVFQVEGDVIQKVQDVVGARTMGILAYHW